MDIPVSGFLVSSNDGDHHSHKLYITSWDGRPVHVHAFAGTTSVVDDHAHEYAGVTAPAMSGVPHTHEYFAQTSFTDGHTHMIRGRTSDAVPLPGGDHMHYFQGYTTVDGLHPHAHAYQGRTSGER